MDGNEYINAFDVVCFIIKNYRKVLVDHVAEKFKMPTETIKEIYHGLEIYPLEKPKEVVSSIGVKKVYSDPDKVRKNLGGKVSKSVMNIIESGHELVKEVVTVTVTEPNREPTKRPPSKYTNIDTSIYGVAKIHHSHSR